MGWAGGRDSRLFGLPATCITDGPKLGPTSILAEEEETCTRASCQVGPPAQQSGIPEYLTHISTAKHLAEKDDLFKKCLLSQIK